MKTIKIGQDFLDILQVNFVLQSLADLAFSRIWWQNTGAPERSQILSG